MKKIYSTLKLILPILFLIGCSGGGGSSSDSSGGGGTTPPPSTIAYVGLTTPATITESNSEDMVFRSLLGVETGGYFALSAESQDKQFQSKQSGTVPNHPNVIDLPLVLKSTSKNISFNVPKRYPLSAAVSAVRTSTEVINGNCGGTATYTLNINDATGTYNGTFIFSQYCEDNIVISGDTNINGTVNLTTLAILTVTYVFENLTVDDFIYKGDVFVNDSVTPQIITLDLLAKDSVSNMVYWAKDYSLIMTEINATDIEIDVTGTYYDPDQGYVTVSTPEPLLVSTEGWPILGILLCLGDKNTKAKLTAINNYSFKIEADTNGDDVYNYNSGSQFWPEASSWLKLLGSESSGWEYGESIAVDSIGNSYITGHTNGKLDGNINAYGSTAFVLKYDAYGNKQWAKVIGSSIATYGNGIAVDAGGNSYITGYTDGDLDGNINAGDKDILVAKYDANGNKLWSKLLGTSRYDGGYGIAVDLIGNCYIVGNTSGNLDGNINSGSQDIFVSKFDTNGNKLWTKQLGTIQIDGGVGIAVDIIGNCYITGGSSGNLDGNDNAGPGATDFTEDIFVTKYDTNGNKLWTKLFGTYYSEVGKGIAIDIIGNIYITGQTNGNLDGNTNSGGWDIFVTKLDVAGNKLWTKLLGTPGTESAKGIVVDSDGNAFITGYTDGNLDENINAGDNDILVAKYDANGNKLWSKLLGTSRYDGGYGIALDPNGNLYMTGMTDGNLGGNINSGGDEIFIWKLVQP